VTEQAEIPALLARAATGSHADRLSVVEQLDQAELSWPRQARVHVLRNFTAEPLEAPLKLAAFSRGLKLHWSCGDHDTYFQDILDPASTLHSSQADVVVLALWLESLPMAFDPEGRLQTAAVVEHVRSVVTELRNRVGGLIILNTFLEPCHGISRGWPSRSADDVRALNIEIRRMVGEVPSTCVADFEALRASIGEAHDLRYWFMFKSPLTQRFLTAWADVLGQMIASSKGGQKKVLVLDCDNTLWGGICGEDGLSGIRLGPSDYPGVVFWSFQRQLLELQRTGVLLTLCSKNNEADVMEVLDRHPSSLLRPHHLAGWRVNWRDKASNIVELADELRLGLDALVFVDDSPVELEQVRQSLPMVDTLAVPKKLYELPGLLAHYNRFSGVIRTEEDASRTAQYTAERERTRQSVSFTSHDAFLESLELEATIGEALPEELPRVAQLTQKTNQFNVTTRRYSENEIEWRHASSDSAVVILRVRDRFGDYGLTGLALLSNADGHGVIDTFLMSCRVLGRRMEDALLDEVMAFFHRRWQCGEITAEYIASAKNQQVAEFFPSRGFEVVEQEGTGTRYSITAASYEPSAPTMVRIKRRE